MDDIFERCTWLSKEKKKSLKEVLSSLPETGERRKIAGLLLSILYAEADQKQKGKIIALWAERFLEKFNLTHRVCATLGDWNFHTCHAARFGLSKKAFVKELLDFKKGAQYVVTHIREDIGLEKSVDCILAEYNHNVMATSVAALQRGLNQKTGSRITEDGLLGRETKSAILRHRDHFPPSFSLENLDEEMVLEAMRAFRTEPFVPERVVKKNIAYLWRRPWSFSRLRGIFERDIDVPKYVEAGSVCFSNLLGESR